MDVLGFKQSEKNFIVNELAIICLTDYSDPLVRLFKCPIAWQSLKEKYRQENQWLKKNYHELPWFSGDYDYSKLRPIIRESFSDAIKFFVGNEECKNWLAVNFDYDNVINLADYGYPVKDLPRHTGHNLSES